MNEDIILENFSKRFSELIKNSSIDISQLAKMLGIKSKSTIYRYMNGEMAPKVPTVKYASDIFNVNPLWLMGYDAPKYNNEKTKKLDNLVSPINILKTIKSDYDYLAPENIVGTINVEKSLVGNGEDYFALKIKGDSMSPILMENDIAIIKKQENFESGNIVVAIVNHNEATIRKVRKNDTSILLQSFNPNYEPIVFTYDEMETIPVTIIGVVKQLKREF